MLSLTANVARLRLPSLIDQAATSHEPVLIEGNHNRVLLISEELWRNLNDALRQDGETATATSLTASTARIRLSSLIDQVATSHDLVLIEGNHNRALLVSEELWQTLNDALHQDDEPAADPYPIRKALTRMATRAIFRGGRLGGNCD